MTNRHWLITGLVAALVLVAGGYLWGFRAGSSTPAEQKDWRVEVDSALGVERDAHRRVVYSLRISVESLGAASADAMAAAVAAQRDEQLAARRAGALDDSLSAARVRGDSAAMVRSLEGAVANLRTELVHVKRAREEWRGAYTVQLAKAATLQRRVNTDSARVVELEELLERAPTPGNPASGKRVLRSVETVAIGAVTARACEASLLSVGCLSGVVVTAARVM